MKTKHGYWRFVRIRQREKSRRPAIMRARENANARREPGERVNRLTDKPKLRTRMHHVNGSYGEAELCAAKARRALRKFAKAVTEARKVFAAAGGVGAAGGVRAWLVFYDAKQAAYAKLVVALPQVAAIPDFWRYVQNMPVAQWLPVIEAQVAQISRSRSWCRACGAVEVTWPSRRCAQCQKARRRQTYRNAKQRKRIKEEMRKCGACQIEPLGPRQRVCFNCKSNARRERNRRYQKSLKERNLRRVQPDFTREDLSTLPGCRVSTPPAPNVEREAVLVSGATSAGDGDLHAADRLEYSTLEVTR
jgi:hypothetical protein